MSGFFSSLFGYFLSSAGLVILAALDASLIFFLPFGVDVVLIVLVARNAERWWLYPLLATSGSVAGSALTFEIGRRAGEAGLERFLPRQQLDRVRRRVEQRAAFSTAALAAVPPPFPFTAFVLASGALNVRAVRFLAMLAAVRLGRFLVEAALARRYGERVVSWIESDVFRWSIGGFAVLAVAGTVYSAVVLWRRARRAGSVG